MKEVPYVSVLAERLTDYVRFRRSVGFEIRTQVYILRKFDRVLRREMKGEGPVTRQIVESFLESLDGLAPLTRRMQLSVVRQFLIYMRRFQPKTFIPGPLQEPSRSSPRTPHIYTDDEIRSLLREALCYPRRYRARRGLTYYTLIAMLYATGMRISEALSLTLADVDLDSAVLRIRKTKFHKSRLVPLARSSCRGIRRFLVERAEKGHPTHPEAPFFVGYRLPCLSYSAANQAFRQIARQAGIRGPVGTRGPRVHDLRHTAAVRRLSLWYKEGKDVQALLPVLSTYLGHSSVSSTEIYLTTTAELLAEASARFERHFNLDIEANGELAP